jgi:protocatechuate 3,4-dioxygenase beta subunit
MPSANFSRPRRNFLRSVAFGAAAVTVPGAFTVPGVFAEELTRTPEQTEGPFYPDRLPLDTDNDLLILNDSITPAVGQITHLGGRVLGVNGKPIRGAVVEIWQVDSKGSYLHSRGSPQGKRDANFQGFGRFLTAADGTYYFRTIKPVSYPGRAPHIHFAINKNGRRILATQMYVKGEAQNDRDFIVRSLRNAKVRESVMVDFRPIPDSRIGELAARFDIVVGLTPEDPAKG